MRSAAHPAPFMTACPPAHLQVLDTLAHAHKLDGHAQLVNHRHLGVIEGRRERGTGTYWSAGGWNAGQVAREEELIAQRTIQQTACAACQPYVMRSWQASPAWQGVLCSPQLRLTTAPPRAVPSSLVRMMPLSCTVSLNSFA